MTKRRASKLVLEAREMIDLDIEFNISRNLKVESNTAEVTVYNLSQDTRSYLAQLKAVTVQLHAGYSGDGDSPHLLFQGKLREVTSAKQGATWTTKVSSGDGDGKNKHVSFSIGPGTSLAKVVERVAGELRQGIGNVLAATRGGKFLNGGTTFPTGTVVHGPADQELERLLRSMGKTYSVQNGDIQVLDDSRPNSDTAYVLNQDSGLVGSPEIGTIKNEQGNDVRGAVKARSLLTGEIYPGRQVKIESLLVDGYFRVSSAVYSGQTDGPDWYVDLEATPVRRK